MSKFGLALIGLTSGLLLGVGLSSLIWFQSGLAPAEVWKSIDDLQNGLTPVFYRNLLPG